MTSLGRPRDSFGDPVVRLRSWAWDWRLCSDTGLEAPAALARKFCVPSQGLFLKVRYDGADPQRLQVGDTCLAKFVATLPEGLGAYQDCTHDLWDALARLKMEKRPHSDPLASPEFVSKMQSFGILRISSMDILFGRFLGLPRQVPHSEIPSETDLHLEPARFASLDGLHMLLHLYRNATHEGSLKYAGIFGDALEQAVNLYVNSRWPNNNEIQDTWHWILHSRMLSWRTYLKPTAAQLELSREVWIERDENCVAVDAPSQELSLPRRERRKIFVNACAAMFSKDTPQWDYVWTTEVLQWLAENREPITENVMWALENFNPSKDDVTLVHPAPLVMPSHLFCLRTRPQGPEIASTGVSLGRVFELVSVVEAKPK